MEYSPGDSMSFWLGTSVNVYENAYLDYWGLQNPQLSEHLTKEERRRHDRLREIGTALQDCLHSLNVEEALLETIRRWFETLDLGDHDVDEMWGTWEEDALAKLAQILAAQAIVQDSLRIALGWEAAEGLLAHGEERAAYLMSLVTMRRLSERARAYLDRATKMFLWGFDPECIAMCRAVLEAALDDVLPLEDEDDKRLGLERLLEQAGRFGRLQGFQHSSTRRGWTAQPGSLLWKADRIRWTANDVLHFAPVVGSELHEDDLVDPKTALTDLAEILNQLFPTR